MCMQLEEPALHRMAGYSITLNTSFKYYTLCNACVCQTQMQSSESM